ncbi:MAG: helix-turn-helix transcriptional regulator [Chloroflexota bacterium]|jgi:hypothetical protein|nr:helix-turn-helix transcriptional regulator [Chloroflexota bacterium]
MDRDFLANQLRDALLRLDQLPERAAEPPAAPEPDIRQSVRRLSRARVALLLRQIRAANALTYSQVQTDTGLSQQLLFDVEFKDRRLTLDELRLLAECYGVSVNDILGIDID